MKVKLFSAVSIFSSMTALVILIAMNYCGLDAIMVNYLRIPLVIANSLSCIIHRLIDY